MYDGVKAMMAAEMALAGPAKTASTKSLAPAASAKSLAAAPTAEMVKAGPHLKDIN